MGDGVKKYTKITLMTESVASRQKPSVQGFARGREHTSTYTKSTTTLQALSPHYNSNNHGYSQYLVSLPGSSHLLPLSKKLYDLLDAAALPITVYTSEAASVSQGQPTSDQKAHQTWEALHASGSGFLTDFKDSLQPLDPLVSAYRSSRNRADRVGAMREAATSVVVNNPAYMGGAAEKKDAEEVTVTIDATNVSDKYRLLARAYLYQLTQKVSVTHGNAKVLGQYRESTCGSRLSAAVSALPGAGYAISEGVCRNVAWVSVVVYISSYLNSLNRDITSRELSSYTDATLVPILAGTGFQIAAGVALLFALVLSIWTARNQWRYTNAKHLNEAEQALADDRLAWDPVAIAKEIERLDAKEKSREPNFTQVCTINLGEVLAERYNSLKLAYNYSDNAATNKAVASAISTNKGIIVSTLLSEIGAGWMTALTLLHGHDFALLKGGAGIMSCGVIGLFGGLLLGFVSVSTVLKIGAEAHAVKQFTKRQQQHAFGPVLPPAEVSANAVLRCCSPGTRFLQFLSVILPTMWAGVHSMAVRESMLLKRLTTLTGGSLETVQEAAAHSKLALGAMAFLFFGGYVATAVKFKVYDVARAGADDANIPDSYAKPFKNQRTLSFVSAFLGFNWMRIDKTPVKITLCVALFGAAALMYERAFAAVTLDTVFALFPDPLAALDSTYLGHGFYALDIATLTLGMLPAAMLTLQLWKGMSDLTADGSRELGCCAGGRTQLPNPEAQPLLNTRGGRRRAPYAGSECAMVAIGDSRGDGDGDGDDTAEASEKTPTGRYCFGVRIC